MTDNDSSRLLEAGHIHLNFHPLRLLILRAQFAQVTIADLGVHITRENSETNTINEMASRWQRSAPETAVGDMPEDESENGGESPVSLIIDSLQLANISLHLTDQVPQTPFITTLTLASADIADISTVPEAQGDKTVNLELEGGAQIAWQGGFRVNPPAFNGRINLSGFSLSTLARYFQDTLPFQVDDGKLHLALDYAVDLAGTTPRVDLNGINVALETLQFTESGAAEPFFSGNAIRLENGQINLPANRAIIPAVTFDGLELIASRDSNGDIDLQRMISRVLPTDTPVESEPESPSSDNNSAPWQVAVNAFSMESNELVFNDSSLATPFHGSATVDLALTNISNTPQTRFPLSVGISLDTGGSVSLSGDLAVLPVPDITGTLTIDTLALGLVQPYLGEYTALVLESGALASSINFASGENDPLSLGGNLTITNVSIEDELLGESLVSMGGLEVDNMGLSLAQNTIDISEIILSDFQARILINEDGSTNIGASLGSREGSRESNPGPAVQEADTDSEPAALPSFILGRIRLDNAGVDFTDRNLPFEFNADIRQLSGLLENLSNRSSQAATVSLEGQVGEFGLMQLDSKLDPFAVTSNAGINLRFTNIELPSATPYVIKFAGREVDDGVIDLTLNYALTDELLDASNRMVVRILILGDRIEHPGAMDLPLDLALALLKDTNGEIDLEIPVAGQVNDPEFDFGPAIQTAIRNVLTNLVTAPFRLLGRLAGGGDTELDHIRFLPGRADIAPPERQVIQQLGEALAQRPQLILEIPLLDGGETDILALKTRAVNNRIEDRLASDGQENETLVNRQTDILETLYTEVMLTPALDAVRLANMAIQSSEQGDENPEGNVATELDIIAYNRDLRERLIDAEPLGRAELDRLATARWSNVETAFAETGLALSRLRITDAVFSETDDEGWLTMRFEVDVE